VNFFRARRARARARAARAAAPPLLRVHKNAPAPAARQNNEELGPGICPKSLKCTRIFASLPAPTCGALWTTTQFAWSSCAPVFG
jgi:hypothetical protein